MKKLKLSLTMKCICVAFFAMFATITIGCGKSGEVEEEPSFITPSIQNLQTQSTNIAKCTGGILSFTCDWMSPEKVNSANAYLSFVKTIDLPVTEPIGIIGSAAEMIISQSANAVMSNQVIAFDDTVFARMATTGNSTNTSAEIASDSINTPEAIADFYRRYAEPILIPVRINTNEIAGQFYAQIPFTTNDIASAPLGVHQMLVYMKINGYKTNTLAFELTFVP